jgi:hypothetical protein
VRKRMQPTTRSCSRRWLSSLTVAVAALAVLALGPASAMAATGEQVYSSIPDPLPANLASLGGEAYSFSQLGDQVQFAASGGKLSEVEVTMSDWACGEGKWTGTGEEACTTTPGTGFELPITFNIYEVGEENAVGPLLATRTQTFFIPYRPSSTTEHGCDGKSWYDEASETCNHGLATNISFDFASQELTLPEKVIYGISYDTTHHGPEPVGEGAACYSSSAGCGYDALNIALSEEVLTGSQVNPGTLYWDSTYAGFYCDEGAGGTGTFRLDSPGNACWSGEGYAYIPAVAFYTAPEPVINPPTSPSDCRPGSWQEYTDASGTPFTDKADCLAYFGIGPRSHHGHGHHYGHYGHRREEHYGNHHEEFGRGHHPGRH